MFKNKFLSKMFSLFSAMVVVLILMSPTQALAKHDPANDRVLAGQGQLVIDPTNSKESLVVTFQYQYGITNVEVHICDSNVATDSMCRDNSRSAFIDYVNPEVTTSGKNIYMNEAYKTQSLTTITYKPSAPSLGTPIKDYVNGTYKIVVSASFCEAVKADGSCAYWGGQDAIYSQTFELKGAFTGNAKVNTVLSNILVIVNDYVIPILWVALGILLVVRGVILAIGIVKASDEAEVRANKIKGLVWLIIGVVAGYAITIAASWVMTLLGYGGVFG